MNAARALLAAIKGDPAAMRRLHAFLTIAWLLAVVPVVLTDLKRSIELLVFISIYANVAGHWSSWQAARVEEKQDAPEPEEKQDG